MRIKLPLLSPPLVFLCLQQQLWTWTASPQPRPCRPSPNCSAMRLAMMMMTTSKGWVRHKNWCFFYLLHCSRSLLAREVQISFFFFFFLNPSVSKNRLKPYKALEQLKQTGDIFNVISSWRKMLSHMRNMRRACDQRMGCSLFSS